MNLKEVMQDLCDGKVLHCKSYDYKLYENELCFWGIGEKWIISDLSINYIAKNNCQISETDPEAEYKKSLEPKHGALGFDKCNIIVSIPSRLLREGVDISKQAKFNSALNTLIEIKAHPLSVAPVDGERQYCIELSDSCGELFDYGFYNGVEYKLDKISPFFKSTADMDKVIKEIGKDKLISMFKVLQGVYDE